MKMRVLTGALCASVLALAACNVQTNQGPSGNAQAPANNAAPQQAIGGGQECDDVSLSQLAIRRRRR